MTETVFLETFWVLKLAKGHLQNVWWLMRVRKLEIVGFCQSGVIYKVVRLGFCVI